MLPTRTRYLVISCMAVVFTAAFASLAHADTQGQQQTFFVNSRFDGSGRSSIIATLQQVSTRAYFYVDNDYWNQLNVLQQESLLRNLGTLASEFDNTIYPREIAAFGSEPNPGIDNDVRITVLLQHMSSGTGGYFETVNLYPKSQSPSSNQREMINVNVTVMGTDLAKVFLGHEFQHLISFHQKEQLRDVSEEIWLNEARSEYAATINGYNTPFQDSNLDQRTRSFLRTPSDSLTEWPNTATDYGITAVFAEYLGGRFGSGIITDTLREVLSGIPSLNDYWRRNGSTETFVTVFRDWMLATSINDKSKDARYGYVNPNMSSVKVVPQYRATIAQGSEAAVASLIKNWQPVWYEFQVAFSSNPTKVFRFELSADSRQNFIFPHVVFYNDGSYDVFEATLTDVSQKFYVINPSPAGRGTKLISKILAAATNALSTDGAEETHTLTIRAKAADENETQAALNSTPSPTPTSSPVAGLPDGALIKRNNPEPQMYVTWGKYKRYLRPEVIKLYGHLDPARVVPVSDPVFNSYATSNYVRYVNDPKVYAIWPDGTKHWLRITAAQWDASGRDWNAIFIISEAELNFYTTGVDITR